MFGFDTERLCVSVSLGSDGILEDTEELQLSLASEEAAVILDPEKAVVTILDTDGKCDLLLKKGPLGIKFQ